MVLGDAQGPVEDSLIHRGVHAGDFADVISGYARDLLGVLRRVAGDFILVSLEVFRGPLDEFLVVEVFVDDHVRHGNVRAHVEAEPLVRFLYLIYLSRIHYGHLCAVLYAAAHVVVDDGVALHGVRSSADYEVGVLELFVRGGCSARSKRCHQTGDAGGMSSTVTRVYVTVPEDLADEPARQIVELVCRAGGAKEPEGVGTVLVFDLAHLAGDKIQSLVPGSKDQLAVFAHEGSRQPPVAVEVAPALATFDAGLTLAARVLLVSGNFGNDSTFNLDGQPTADATESADRGQLARAVGLAVLVYFLRRGHNPRPTLLIAKLLFSLHSNFDGWICPTRPPDDTCESST